MKGDKNVCEVCGKPISKRAKKCKDCEEKGRAGPAAPNWQGGEVVNGQGRVLVWIPPAHPFGSMRNSKGYVYRARLRYAIHMGRPLKPEESIHHIDKDVTNDEMTNLQLFDSESAHQKFHCRLRTPKKVNSEREEIGVNI